MFKPMLATDAELDKLRFPLLASAKLDGFRAIVKGGVVLSRSLKPIPNVYVQEAFRNCEYFDGELIFGDPTAKDVFRRSSTAVMSDAHEDGKDVRLFAFDHIADVSAPYRARHCILKVSHKEKKNKRVILHEQHVVTCLDTLLKLEEKLLNEGYEGLILRDPASPYKFGRSTVKEGYLLKLKRFVDAEAVVIGFEERMHNGNEATTNELGRTKRSSHMAGKTGRGDLGALVVRFGDVEFNIGTGFDDVERRTVWGDRDSYLGRLAKFKYFPVGVKEAPRHPVFLGWRDEGDMS